MSRSILLTSPLLHRHDLDDDRRNYSLRGGVSPIVPAGQEIYEINRPPRENLYARSSDEAKRLHRRIKGAAGVRAVDVGPGLVTVQKMPGASWDGIDRAVKATFCARFGLRGLPFG